MPHSAALYGVGGGHYGPKVTATSANAYARYTWGVLWFTGAVILFGAVVRITGSGAGCGQHWPTCQGEVAHLPQSVETAIELTHRLTSGVNLLLVIGLYVWSRRVLPSGHTSRKAAGFTLVFILIEALIGAGLVLARLVGNNESGARAIVMSAHLVNTCLLTAALVIAAWTAKREASVSLRPRGVEWVAVVGLIGILLVSMTGAITALGDTLYPVAAGEFDLAHATTDGAHFLKRLRIVHPVLAIAVALGLVYCANRVGAERTSSPVGNLARAVRLLVFVQIGAGAMNIVLSAPGWMQVVHLALATLVWVCVVLLLVAAIETRTASKPAARLT